MNAITVGNRYSLSLIVSAFDLLQGATTFTELDLRNAYHLVRIRKGDEWKTPFHTHPRVSCNAIWINQRAGHALVNYVLQDSLHRFVFVYLNDIVMFPKSSAEHVRPISLVLQCLLQHSLFVKTEKSKLHASFVPFLGYILGQGVVKIDPALVEAVAKWPASVS